MDQRRVSRFAMLPELAHYTVGFDSLATPFSAAVYMQDHRLWHWLIHFVRPLIMPDTRLRRGDVVTARELAAMLCGAIEEVTEAEALEVAIEAIEQLIEDGELKPAKCSHGMLRAFDPCERCGHSAQLVATKTELKLISDVRERIWRVLVAHPGGLTRGELSLKSDAPEKTVCWAIRDWINDGLCAATGATRRTMSGHMAQIIKALRRSSQTSETSET